MSRSGQHADPLNRLPSINHVRTRMLYGHRHDDDDWCEICGSDEDVYRDMCCACAQVLCGSCVWPPWREDMTNTRICADCVLHDDCDSYITLDRLAAKDFLHRAQKLSDIWDKAEAEDERRQLRQRKLPTVSDEADEEPTKDEGDGADGEPDDVDHAEFEQVLTKLDSLGLKDSRS